MQALTLWNANVLVNIQRKIKSIVHQLNLNGHISIHKQLFKQLRDLRKQEEIMWWQRAKHDFLAYGDSNS